MSILETSDGGSLFSMKFMKWIMEYIHTVNYFIMINGEPTTPFDTAKGLRQGDPISPFLFPITMKYLISCLAELKENR